MTDFSSAANFSGGGSSGGPGGAAVSEPNSAFADALQRAKQIAAKITPVVQAAAAATTATSEGNGIPGVGIKRPLEESSGIDWSGASGDQSAAKKMAAINDPIGAQLAAMQQQHRMGGMTTEKFQVPDKMVGLIIGRGGEQITRLQAESGCKIQMAGDSGGQPNRTCLLAGSQMAIDKAKELITEIVDRGNANAPSRTASITNSFEQCTSPSIEILIPASKVGLIIGKDGDTIKNLQERSGVKMVMVQAGPFANASEKPLRIKGDPQKSEYARQLVMDLLTESELNSQGNGNRTFNRNNQSQQENEYDSSQSEVKEMNVPRQAVGVVIGKGGEMIKKIQKVFGTRVQFKREEGVGDRVCQLSGTPEQIEQAEGMIHDLINSVMRDQQGGGRARARLEGFGESGFQGGGNDGSGESRQQNRGGGGGGNNNPDCVEYSYMVPSDKCGFIIGKRGETIRGINQQSGAHVELSRETEAASNEKVFVIRGLPNQVEHAKQLISEKLGGSQQSGNSGGGGGGGGGGGPPHQNYGMPQVNQNGPPPPPPNYNQHSQPQQQMQQQQQKQPQQQQQPQQQPQQQMQQMQGMPQAYPGPQSWANAYQPWPAQMQQTVDTSKQVVDAWAAYYAQCYNQAQQQMVQPVAAMPQVAAATPVPQSTSASTTVQQQAPAMVAMNPAVSTAVATTLPDYSVAWVEYYRSVGMYREAEMIQQQARLSQQQQQPAAPPQTAQSLPAVVPLQQPPPPPMQAVIQPQPPFAQYGQQPVLYGPPPFSGALPPPPLQQPQAAPQPPVGPFPVYNYGAYPPPPSQQPQPQQQQQQQPKQQ